MKEATPDQVRSYINDQLQKSDIDAGLAAAQPVFTPSVPLEHYFANEQELSSEEEKELLEFLNNPNGVNDGFW
ncbi:MAG: hypothetical protein JWQ01_1541 [Massilia sp.]|nr:hypothetical protein [Massilia sp.]